MKKLVFVFIAFSLVAFAAIAQDAASSGGNSLLINSTGQPQPILGVLPLAGGSPGTARSFVNLSSFNPLSSGNFSPFAQEPKPRFESAEDDATFPKGSLAFSLGVGFGDLFWSGYGSALGVSPVLDIDYALTDQIGIGNISIGGTVAYTSTKYTYYDEPNASYSAILVGLRGAYHFILDADALKGKLDPYAGILLGFVITSNPATNSSYYHLPGTKASAFQPGIFAGARYFFIPHFGAFAELGYNGFSIFTIGITVKTK
jgi:hypothetical protein